jgi:hypothetical protein
MPNEGGGIMGSRILGIPTIVWIGGVAIVVYFLFFRNSQAGQTGSATGGSGTVTTGNTTLQQGAITIDVAQGGGRVKKKLPTKKQGWMWFTPTKSGTLSDLVADEKWPKTSLAEIEALNSFKANQEIKAGTKIKIPLGLESDTTSSAGGDTSQPAPAVPGMTNTQSVTSGQPANKTPHVIPIGKKTPKKTKPTKKVK